jgi:hypothetical protein
MVADMESFLYGAVKAATAQVFCPAFDWPGALFAENVDDPVDIGSRPSPSFLSLRPVFGGVT